MAESVAASELQQTSDSADFARSYANMIWQYRQAETVAAMIHVGDRLGLFAAMADAGPLTAGDLAARTGLHPRWLLEWMRLQASARVLLYRGDDRFELPHEANDLLANSSSAGIRREQLHRRVQARAACRPDGIIPALVSARPTNRRGPTL